MKVLIIHSAYKYRGGEDTVVAEELRLIRAHGVHAELLEFNNGHHTIANTIQLPFNRRSYKTTLTKLRVFQPDLVHIHNLHFAASPSIIYALQKTGTPFVCTLHNYRLLCPSAILFHKGQPFLSSVNQPFPWQAVLKGVYRNSKLLTLWMAISMKLHHQAKTWEKCSRFIVLTNYARELFLHSKMHLRANQIVVKPNFCSIPPLPPSIPGEHFLYAGRLSDEKGLHLLLAAFSASPFTLKIAGDGPLKEEVLAHCKNHTNIQYLGTLQKEALLIEMGSATALLFPSVWFEGMPLTIIEAFAVGLPVIASRLGAMDDMVTPEYNGLHFEAGNLTSLTEALVKWQQLPREAKQVYRQNAREAYENCYTPQKNAERLLAIYEAVLAEQKPSLLTSRPAGNVVPTKH